MECFIDGLEPLPHRKVTSCHPWNGAERVFLDPTSAVVLILDHSESISGLVTQNEIVFRCMFDKEETVDNAPY